MFTYAFRVLLVVVLVFCCTSITSFQFKTIWSNCINDKAIFQQCNYDIFENSVDNTTCSKDYYKSYICETSFSNCVNLADDEQVPLVCWLCWVQSPSESQVYPAFQQCMISKVYGSHALLGIGLLLMIMAIFC